MEGEQGKPDIKANKNIGFQNDHSSEKERKVPTKHSKSSKNATIKVDREEIIVYPLPTKWNKQLKELLPQETVFTEIEFNALLDEYLSKLSFQYRTRVQEAAAIAFYHQQTNIPLIKALVCDDAPQFKLLTADLALCWVHEARHYKKRFFRYFYGENQNQLDFNNYNLI